MIHAVVGAGGKTSLIHSLAEKYRKEGKSVFITTTTHMYREPDTLLTDDPEKIIARLNSCGYAFAGLPCGEKISSLSYETYEKVCACADEVLVEADGSRHMPLKLPASHEPVIPANADKITVVCGLHALGSMASEVVFRLSEVPDSFGVAPNDIITPKTLQHLVRKGYRDRLKKEYPDKELSFYAANDGSLYQRALAALIEADMDTDLLAPEWFSKKPCLFICGAGHVAKELADLAARIDMRVKVIDPRPEFANRERFPFAEQIICDSFSSLKNYLEPDAFYAVMTPGHVDDFTCVGAILDSSYRYLGMMGSRKKVAKVREDLAVSGFSEQQIATLHAPIGLSIGAISPAEIAVSVLAEIIEIKNRYPNSSAQSQLLNSTEHGVLCIIIEKRGSAPRGAGSMMLVTDHAQIDTIGGGAIEYAAINDAKAAKAAFVREYSLSNETARTLGMVCGGTNKILFLPV